MTPGVELPPKTALPPEQKEISFPATAAGRFLIKTVLFTVSAGHPKGLTAMTDTVAVPLFVKLTPIDPVVPPLA